MPKMQTKTPVSVHALYHAGSRVMIIARSKDSQGRVKVHCVGPVSTNAIRCEFGEETAAYLMKGSREKALATLESDFCPKVLEDLQALVE